MSVSKEVIQKLIEEAKDAFDQSDFERAYQLYVQADERQGEVADDDAYEVRSQKALIQNAIADAAIKTGRCEEALKRAEKAVGIYEKIGDKAGTATGLQNIGNAYRWMSDYPKALEFYQKLYKATPRYSYKTRMEQLQ